MMGSNYQFYPRVRGRRGQRKEMLHAYFLLLLFYEKLFLCFRPWSSRSTFWKIPTCTQQRKRWVCGCYSHRCQTFWYDIRFSFPQYSAWRWTLQILVKINHSIINDTFRNILFKTFKTENRKKTIYFPLSNCKCMLFKKWTNMEYVSVPLGLVSRNGFFFTQSKIKVNCKQSD